MAQVVTWLDGRPRRYTCASILIPLVVAYIAAMTSCRADHEGADLVFHGGPILTMSKEPATVEAVAIDDGQIRAVGSTDRIMEFVDRDTVIVDLEGRTLVPGFIDAHGHFTEVARIMGTADIQSPPVGPVRSIEEIISALKEKIESEGIDADRWVVGSGYDERLLIEARHPTKEDLDRVSTRHPVAAIHASGRLGSLNSRALEIAGITTAADTSEDGVIERKPGTREPTGVMREGPFFRARRLMDRESDPQKSIDRARRAGRYYASFGITTTQDGGTDDSELQMLAAAEKSGALAIDVVCFLDAESADDALRKWSQLWRASGRRVRIGGVSVTLDRPPERWGAWMTRPYTTAPDGQDPEYAGEPTFEDDNEVFFFFHKFISQEIQITAHVNGDAAADQMIAAVENAFAMIGRGDYRPIMHYAHVIRADQLDRMKALGIEPSYFPGRLFFHGDLFYESILGAERTQRLSPCQSTLQRGMNFSIHNDEPDVPPNVLFLIGNAVNRISRDGRVLGADQRIDVGDALKPVTIRAARQIFEEDRKGSIENGKLADLVVLSGNPLEVVPDVLGDLRVLATFKEGKLILRSGFDSRGQNSSSSSSPPTSS